EQMTGFKRLEYWLKSSQLIKDLPSFTTPGDTTGDTKLTTVFVARSRSSDPRQTWSQFDDEIADVTASRYLSAVFGEVEASFSKRGSSRNGCDLLADLGGHAIERENYAIHNSMSCRG